MDWAVELSLHKTLRGSLPLLYFRFKNRQNWTVKWRSSEDNRDNRLFIKEVLYVLKFDYLKALL